jgi:hypothetical protein
VVDRITILRLKLDHLEDPERRQRLVDELADLEQRWGRAGLGRPPEEGDLAAVNAKLWDVEDALRLMESAGDFGPEFVALARSVYTLNDTRAALKRQINQRLGSALIEEKIHPC